MASLHIVYGIVKNSSVFSGAGLGSETVVLPGAGAAIPAAYNAARVKAIDAATWVWLSGDGSGGAGNPRIYLAAGDSFDFLTGIAGKTISGKAYP